MLENEEDTADSVPVSSSGETDLAGGGADKAAEGASAPGTGIPSTRLVKRSTIKIVHNPTYQKPALGWQLIQSTVTPSFVVCP